MAKSNAVWGIDIGQCALKALRCVPGDEPGEIIADAFDFIEYPKILSQPDADPAALVHDALELFLSRNEVKGDRVAISVSGQSGLARFIKLPPVESKKIPDIVKYEARQQIPFALEDVVWDYQQMAGGSEEDGFALETEVGLFAMKRDQVFRALKPFEEAGIEVDVIQLTPLTIYNFTVFDLMPELPPPEQYDPDNPPESVVILSLGTDTTDLVVTNGYRVWQRSVPMGGSHFTKALTKELRLTFAKAEHLKRNATQAQDPKAVFQAMRPVFNDLVTEVQRSIGYFTSIDRKANIGRVIALGNAMKLPGLQKYLSQNLGYPVTEVQKYRGLGGDTVVGEAAFKENLLSFAVCYGLVLQGMGQAKLGTNLLPREIVTDRMIRDKKPWAVAMVAVLLLGCTLSFLGHYRAVWSVDDSRFKSDLDRASGVVKQATDQRARFEEELAKFKRVSAAGDGLIGNVDGRLLWLNFFKAFDQCLPGDPPENRPDNIFDRNEVHIREMNCEYFKDLNTWYANGVADKIKELQADVEAKPAEANAAAGAVAATTPPAEGEQPGGNPNPNPDPSAMASPDGAPAAAPDTGPKGAGWVIELTGYHYHNNNFETRGRSFLRDSIIKNLREKKVQMVDKDGKTIEVPVRELGIGYPVLVMKVEGLKDVEIPDPNTVPGKEAKPIKLRRFDFVLQFAWETDTMTQWLENQGADGSGATPPIAAR